MHKKYQKAGFTLPEILIVLAITGFIAILCVTTVKPNDMMFRKLYFRAYNTLALAAYNVQADCTDANNLLIEDSQANGTAEPTDDSLKKFPETTAELCEKLAGIDDGYINTAGAISCGNLVDRTNLTQFDGWTAEQLRNNATFRATNGMRYYLSQMSEIDGSTVVWVDLNGARKPNTAVWKKDRIADIVPFLISNTGVVRPLGAPTYDMRYLSARIIYSSPDVEHDSSAMSFRAAYVGAFHGTVYPLDPMSFTDPISIPSDAVALVSKAPNDPQCDERTPEEFPACSIKIEE